MKMTTCPKCQSTNVFVCETGVGWDFNLGIRNDDIQYPTEDWETYLCTDCGYFENYVTDNDQLKKIKAGHGGAGWRKVG